jgi:hypothetical protein
MAFIFDILSWYCRIRNLIARIYVQRYLSRFFTFSLNVILKSYVYIFWRELNAGDEARAFSAILIKFEALLAALRRLTAAGPLQAARASLTPPLRLPLILFAALIDEIHLNFVPLAHLVGG